MSSTFWTEHGEFRKAEFKLESDLEEAIVDMQAELFGRGRIYLDVKKKIGVRGGQRNIPDGYLIDLSGATPRLFVVENELQSHDPMRHIAVQILEFSLAFESSPRLVRSVLFDSINEDASALERCLAYVAASPDTRNLDHLVDRLAHEAPFAALVIIDEVPDRLERVLSEQFSFGVEILEVTPFEDTNGNRAYRYAPFLGDLTNEPQPASRKPVDLSEVDTVVVPARDDGFENVFLGENRWSAVRIHGSMRPQIRFLATYRVAPISAITNIAPVETIVPSDIDGKWELRFEEPPSEIRPVPLVSEGRVKAPQNLRYTSRERLLNADNLDELW